MSYLRKCILTHKGRIYTMSNTKITTPESLQFGQYVAKSLDYALPCTGIGGTSGAGGFSYAGWGTLRVTPPKEYGSMKS